MELVLSPYDQAKEQFMNDTYAKQIITGKFIRKEGKYYFTTTGVFHEDWYRLPNEVGA